MDIATNLYIYKVVCCVTRSITLIKTQESHLATRSTLTVIMAPRQSLQVTQPVSSRMRRNSASFLPELPLQSLDESSPSKNPELSHPSKNRQPSKNRSTRTALVGVKLGSIELSTHPASAQQSRTYPSASPQENRPTLERYAVSNPERNRKLNTERFDDRPIPLSKFQLEREKQSAREAAMPVGGGLSEPEKSPGVKKWSSGKRIADIKNLAPPTQTVAATIPLGLEDTASPDEPTKTASSGSSVKALDLHNKLQKCFESNLTNAEEQGSIYVYLDPSRPALRKIGRSKDVENRKKKLQYDCGLTLQLVHDRTVNYHKRAETLIHCDLLDLCQPYVCDKCGAKHGEWFSVGDQLARTVVDKWVDFMRQEKPYDPISRPLRPFWTHLISAREPLFKDKNLDIDTLRIYWARILSPSLLDRFDYKMSTLLAHTIWMFLWKFWWQVNAVGAWTMTFIAFQNHVTFLIMFSFIMGTFISMSRDLNQFPQLSKSAKKGKARASLSSPP